LENKQPKIRKIKKFLLIWLIIPLMLDVVNILLLNDVLPSFYIVRDFTLIATVSTFGVWFTYWFAVVMVNYVRKRIHKN
jgi:hypothetical protein